MATAPRPGAANRAEADEVTVSFEYEGETYVIRPNDTSAKIAGQLRRNTGWSTNGLLMAASDDFDIDVIAALIYWSRLLRGENVSWDRLASSITMASLDSFQQVEDVPDEEPDSPEA